MHRPILGNPYYKGHTLHILLLFDIDRQYALARNNTSEIPKLLYTISNTVPPEDTGPHGDTGPDGDTVSPGDTCPHGDSGPHGDTLPPEKLSRPPGTCRSFFLFRVTFSLCYYYF